MLEIFAEKHAVNLAHIISNDKELHKFLSDKPLSEISSKEFFDKTSDWIVKKQSRTFSIIENNEAVGLISLVVTDEGCGEIGIWIASKYWHKGIGTKAMKELFKIAKTMGINKVSGNILKNNSASIGMCENLGGVFNSIDSIKIAVTFNL